jgi:hypothetical protein
MNSLEGIFERVFAQKKEPAEIQRILQSLREPFEIEHIKWKAQSTNRDKTSAQAIAYADPRAYSDRLNDVVGPDGWFELIDVTFSQIQPVGWAGNEKQLIKAASTVTVGVFGVGVHSGAGESWGNDENCYTVAFAQGFKRACYPFGLGRYLYDLPRVWVPYDKENKRLTVQPEMPDWARPVKKCDDCAKEIRPAEHAGRQYSIEHLIYNSRIKYSNRKLCFACQIERSKLKEQQEAA